MPPQKKKTATWSQLERALERDRVAYNDVLGRWWERRSADPAHGRAYRRIARSIHSLVRSSPGLIVDYACGPGHLLAELVKRFPERTFLGVDGSALLLEQAARRLRRTTKRLPARVYLKRTWLPDFSLPPGRADLVVYAFPNLLPSEHGREYSAPDAADTRVARRLARAREPNPEDEPGEDPETRYEQLLGERLIARNLRWLLKPKGLCVRAEYSGAPRAELTELTRRRMAFEDGSLARPVDGRAPERLFRLVRSRYFGSRVTHDVYEQTRDREDKEGGYLLNVLRAL